MSNANLKPAHDALVSNIDLLQRKLPKLDAEAAERAQRTITNLAEQARQIDAQLHYLETVKEVA